MFICIFWGFQVGIFVNVKTFYDFTVFPDIVTPKWKLLSVSISKISILFKIEHTIFNGGLKHLLISSPKVSTIIVLESNED